MKKIYTLALALLFVIVTYATTTVTVNNTSTLQCNSCTYVVGLGNLTFTKTGSPNWSYSESVFNYHTITPGNSYTWNINPPSGYTPVWSTLAMKVQYCSLTRTFNNANSSANYNGCNCSSINAQTFWNKLSDGNYDLYCDIIVGGGNKVINNNELANYVTPLKLHTPINIPHKPVAPLATNTFIIDYDSADATAQQSLFGYPTQRFIWDFNNNYTPQDSALKYFVVAFDSLYDAYNGIGYNRATVNTIRCDSIHMILGQENNSGTADTIVIKLINVNANGYPQNTVMWSHNEIIPANSPLGNDWLQPVLLSIPCGYTVSNNDRFALRVEYHGNKQDTCGFIAGFGNAGQQGVCNLTANRTEFSPFRLSANNFYNANTFTVWTQYLSYGTLPTSTGANIYYDCNQSGQYEPGGGDGENYLQNISVFVQVTTDPSSVNDETNAGIKISQNQPNPFSVNTTIQYELVNNANVTLSVYDITGALVSTQNMGNLSAGKHQATINGTDLNAGIYFYTFNVNGSTVTKKMTVIK